jgi:hypothetical protein
MIARLILALVVGVAVYLLCQLFGPILVSMAVPLAVAVGNWLVQYAGVLAILAFLAYFFAGGFSWPASWRRP